MIVVERSIRDIRDRCEALVAAIEVAAIEVAAIEVAADDSDRNIFNARALLAIYRRRARGPHAPLFADPAWIMLLDLYVRPPASVSINSACLASMAPATTALRHIDRLIAAGLVKRAPSRTDGRRAHLRLTPAGIAAIEAVVVA